MSLTDRCTTCRKQRGFHRSTDKACPIGARRHNTYWQFSNVDHFTESSRKKLPDAANGERSQVTQDC